MQCPKSFVISGPAARQCPVFRALSSIHRGTVGFAVDAEVNEGVVDGLGIDGSLVLISAISFDMSVFDGICLSSRVR